MAKKKTTDIPSLKDILLNDVIQKSALYGVQPTKDWYIRNAEQGIEPWHIAKCFGTWKTLMKAVKAVAPEVCTRMLAEKDFVKRVQSPDITLTTDAKEIIVTFHSGGEIIDPQALSALENLARLTKAKLFILWGREENGVLTSVDELKDLRNVICTNLVLNITDSVAEKVKVYDPLKNWNHVNPTTNYLNHLLGRDKVVLGSPIQAMKSAPRDFDSAVYREFWTTGTVDKLTLPRTEQGLLNNERVKQGAVRLTYNEKLDTFDIRNIQIIDGWAYDMGKRYSANKAENATVEAVNAGDLHLPNISPETLNVLIDACKALKPENLILHDILDFATLNHHICTDAHQVARSLLGKPLTASEEFDLAKSMLRILLRGIHKSTKVSVVKSNHDDFYYKRFAKNGVNGLLPADVILLHESMIAYVKNGFFSPLESLEKEFDNFHLLRPETTSVDGVHNSAERLITKSGFTLNVHGDRGINGTRGALRSLKNAYSFITSGHSHSVEFEGNAICAGMMGKLNQGYNSGQPMTWEHGYAVLYENGAFQVITFED